MREAEEVERLGFPLTTSPSVRRRYRAELQESGLVGMQLQSEFAQTLGEFLPEPLGIRAQLESEYDVVSEPDDDHIAARLSAAPYPDPQVECVVKI
jgi:hypothetical protein